MPDGSTTMCSFVYVFQRSVANPLATEDNPLAESGPQPLELRTPLIVSRGVAIGSPVMKRSDSPDT